MGGKGAPPPARGYDIDPVNHAQLRQTVLGWAVGASAGSGHPEPPDVVLARAERYLAFVLDPLRADVLQAMAERAATPLN